MVKCNSCGRELSVVVPKGTPVYCKLCAAHANSDTVPRKTLRCTLKSLIDLYEASLAHELKYFEKTAKEEYSFEQPYSLIGSQGRIDDYRNLLYWLKKNIGLVQVDVEDSYE